MSNIEGSLGLIGSQNKAVVNKGIKISRSCMSPCVDVLNIGDNLKLKIF